MTHHCFQLPPAGDRNASKQRFRVCAEKGILKHTLPREYDGYNDRFADLVQAHETLGQVCLDTGLILSINAHFWGSIYPLLNYGTDQQRSELLSDLIKGELIGGHAITEPQAGSDINAINSVAIAVSGGFNINGCKRFITNTPIADLLIIYARLDSKLSAFIVKKSDPGVKFTDTPAVSGCSTATMGDVILSNCQVPAARLLGKPGAGSMMIQQALELERAFIFAGISGIMNWQLQEAIRYSRERRIGHAHLGKNQAISHKIADMKLRLDTIKLWLNECAHLKDNHQRITMASAQTKLFASEAFLQSSLDAVHIFGSHGLIPGHKLVTLVNDAMASRLFSGSSEIQKNIIAALSGTGDGFKPNFSEQTGRWEE